MKKKNEKKISNEKLLSLTLEWARGCGKILNQHLLSSFVTPLKMIDKGEQGLATLADLESENFLIKKIKKHFPEHQIISEEDAYHSMLENFQLDKGYTWVIDPLDGTNNFFNRIPMFAVSIAVLKNGLPQVGVVLNPTTGDLFYAVKSKGAWQERVIGKKIYKSKLRASKRRKIFKESLLSANLTSKKIEEGILKRFPEVRAMRRFGSAALELSFVAAGMLDGYWEYNLKPWDMAAAGLICQETGVKISGITGESFNPFNPSVIASHPDLYEMILDVLKNK